MAVRARGPELGEPQTTWWRIRGGGYTSKRKTALNTTTTNRSSTISGPASFTLTFDWMTCGHCVQAVSKALAGVTGVTVRSVAVGSAEITAPDGLTVSRAVNALGEAGYAAKACEPSAGTGAQATSGGSCCGGAKTNAARGGCCG